MYNAASKSIFESSLMSRIYNPDSAGKERTRMTKAVALAVRELARQGEPNDTARDLAAFVALALKAISETIDVSVAAWEKRDYWVKADRFRMEWQWAGIYAVKMRDAILTEDWGTIALVMSQTAQKLIKVDVPAGHRLGIPWTGAYRTLKTGDWIPE